MAKVPTNIFYRFADEVRISTSIHLLSNKSLATSSSLLKGFALNKFHFCSLLWIHKLIVPLIMRTIVFIRTKIDVHKNAENEMYIWSISNFSALDLSRLPMSAKHYSLYDEENLILPHAIAYLFLSAYFETKGIFDFYS